MKELTLNEFMEESARRDQFMYVDSINGVIYRFDKGLKVRRMRK